MLLIYQIILFPEFANAKSLPPVSEWWWINTFQIVDQPKLPYSGFLSFFCSQVFAQQQVVADAIFCDLAKTCVADRWLVAVTSVTVTTEAASMAEVRASFT